MENNIIMSQSTMKISIKEVTNGRTKKSSFEIDPARDSFFPGLFKDYIHSGLFPAIRNEILYSYPEKRSVSFAGKEPWSEFDKKVLFEFLNSTYKGIYSENLSIFGNYQDIPFLRKNFKN
ncbi:MAG: hypothetical protein LBF22_04155 [Deltaproteobacteria bacterium]|jgi:hypothetical protein|nr:hypothetical protein [Deltaproteobacteria bacterium]